MREREEDLVIEIRFAKRDDGNEVGSAEESDFDKSFAVLQSQIECA